VYEEREREAVMARTWGLSMNEEERMELERVIMDEDSEGALEFLRRVIYTKVRESEKAGSCFHEVDKTVEELPRSIRKHKGLGDFE